MRLSDCIAGPCTGQVFVNLRDLQGKLLLSQVLRNLITYDAGILGARLFRNSLDPNPGRSNGVTMWALGTGATGDPNNPDPARREQRRLNREICRRPFSSVLYVGTDGKAVSYPTNVIDLTAVFRDGEAVGALNEMGLLYTDSMDPNISRPIPQRPLEYDPTFDVTGYDVMVNYLPHAVINKPALSVLTLTWRLTFG